MSPKRSLTRFQSLTWIIYQYGMEELCWDMRKRIACILVMWSQDGTSIVLLNDVPSNLLPTSEN